MRLNKYQLDALGTTLGLVAGIAGVIATNGYNPQFWGLVAGLATFLLGYVTNRPATAHPTTKEVEPR